MASSWSHSYPYKADYNDHFETPQQAYRDILPLLDAIQPSRDKHSIYDPYFCNGRTKELLQGKYFGFSNVVHECRDFYKDIANNQVPAHDTLITNPPYSDHHKEKCIEFCLEQLKAKNRPFFVLMPNYVAAREYYRKQVENEDGKEDVVYLLPSTPYEYDHPEGTGHTVSPFASIWYCGIGRDRVDELLHSMPQLMGDGLKLMTSLQQLRAAEAIPTKKRPNPRQRRKRKDNMQATTTATNDGKEAKTENSTTSVVDTTTVPKAKRKKSRHRDPSTGNRTKKRF